MARIRGNEKLLAFNYMDLAVALESSEILSSEPVKFSTILQQWLPKPGNWSVCWRATRDGWKAITFHMNCDGKKPTLTLVKVAKENKTLIFGGYATQSWSWRNQNCK